MPQVIKIKSSTTAGSVPASLTAGEIAVNRADGKIYYLNSSGVVTAISTGTTTFNPVVRAIVFA